MCVFINYISVSKCVCVCVVLPSAAFVAEKAHSHVRSSLRGGVQSPVNTSRRCFLGRSAVLVRRGESSAALTAIGKRIKMRHYLIMLQRLTAQIGAIKRRECFRNGKKKKNGTCAPHCILLISMVPRSTIPVLVFVNQKNVHLAQWNQWTLIIKQTLTKSAGERSALVSDF